MARKVKFDRFMVAIEIASDPKIGRLTDTEFRCLVAGVWPIAAKGSTWGRLLIGNLPMEPCDVAHQARCSETVARKALDKLRDLGMIEPDPDYDCERVHNWDDWQVAPRLEPKDPTGARRQALFRDPELREAVRARDGDDCRYCGITVNWSDRRSPTGGTYDHVDPDGPNSLDNLVVACRGCNSRKGSRTDLSPNPEPGLLRICSPSEEVEREDEVEAPLAPVGESSVTLIAPVKPKGNRARDLDGWQAAITAWVDEYFPGCDPKAIERVVGWVVSQGTDPTPEAVRGFAEAAPNFAHLLEPAA